MVLFLVLMSIVSSKTVVHLVLHSHCDAGWRVTVDQYFHNSVVSILNNMINELQRRPTLRFAWGDILFLKMYLEKNPSNKKAVIELIKEGRLEIVGGGLVQNDEALPDADLVIRQMTLGLEYLRNELNVTSVKVGWQIDPFGHSSLTPALWEKMGFEALVFARIEHTFKDLLEKTGNFEFYWKGSGFGAKKGLLTHILNIGYYLPDIFFPYYHQKCCYSTLPVSANTLQNCVNSLENLISQTKSRYRTENILIPIGGDFWFDSSYYTSNIIDFLYQMQASSSNIEIRISTPSEYFDAVSKSKAKFDYYEGDLLPIVDTREVNDLCWTGYYGTKPLLKKKIKITQRYARAADILQSVLFKETEKYYKLGTLMHHDAITGTSNLPVIQDYLRLAAEDELLALKVIGKCFEELHKEKGKSTAVEIPFKLMFLFNPIGWDVKKPIEIISTFPYIQVVTNNGEKLYVEGVKEDGKYSFFFYYELEAYTLYTFFVREFGVECKDCSKLLEKSDLNSIENEYFSIRFLDGSIDSVVHDNNEYNFKTKLLTYTTRLSGVYTFSFNTPPEELENVSFEVFSGKLLKKAVSVYKIKKAGVSDENAFVVQKIILFKDYDKFLIRTSATPPQDTDIFLSFSKPYSKSSWFYTFNTANILRRDFIQNTHNRNGANFFPINGAFFVEYSNEFLYVIPNFPTLAGRPGFDSFSMNLHRHPAYDDDLGLGAYVPDPYGVDREFSVGFSDLDYNFIWKEYIEYSNYPINLYMKDSLGSLTDNLNASHRHGAHVKVAEKVKLINKNDCIHINNIRVESSEHFINILNICDEPQSIPFDVVREVNVGGNNKEKQKWNWDAPKPVGFYVFNNTDSGIVDFSRKTKEGSIDPFAVLEFTTRASSIEYTDEKSGKQLGFMITPICLVVLLLYFERRIILEIEKRGLHQVIDQKVEVD